MNLFYSYYATVALYVICMCLVWPYLVSNRDVDAPTYTSTGQVIVLAILGLIPLINICALFCCSFQATIYLLKGSKSLNNFLKTPITYWFLKKINLFKKPPNI
jgi:hypothetical protein